MVDAGPDRKIADTGAPSFSTVGKCQVDFKTYLTSIVAITSSGGLRGRGAIWGR